MSVYVDDISLALVGAWHDVTYYMLRYLEELLLGLEQKLHPVPKCLGHPRHRQSRLRHHQSRLRRRRLRSRHQRQGSDWGMMKQPRSWQPRGVE